MVHRLENERDVVSGQVLTWILDELNGEKLALVIRFGTYEGEEERFQGRHGVWIDLTHSKTDIPFGAQFR